MNRIYLDPSFLNRNGGIGTDSRGVLELLIAAKFDVDISPCGAKFEKLPARLFANWKLNRFIKFLPNKYSSIELDDYNFYFSPQVGSPQPSKKFKGQWVVRIHDLFPITNPEWFRPWSILGFRKGMKSILDLKPLLLFNSKTTLEIFHSRFPNYEQAKMLVLPCSIPNLKSLTPCNVCSACRMQLTNRNYIVAVGTIEPRKNYQHLIACFKDSGAKFELFIVGNYGWKSRKTRKLLLKTDGVNWINESCSAGVGRIMEHAKAFISDSADEGFNLPIFEARNYGVPILLSDIPVHIEFHRNEAIFFKPSELTEILSSLNFDKLQKSQFSKNEFPDIREIIKAMSKS